MGASGKRSNASRDAASSMSSRCQRRGRRGTARLGRRNMSTLSIFARIGMIALAVTAGTVLAASPGAAAKRHKPYVYVNKGAETYGDFRTPAGPRRILVPDRRHAPR